MLLLVWACLSAPAHAREFATLHASLKPERLGHGTTLGFGFQIDAPPGEVPSPLTALEISYPGNLGVALSGLGLATCLPATLEAFGPKGCPANSRMGYGSVLAEIPIGPEIIQEPAQLTIFRTPTTNGHIAMLIYALGKTPVEAQVVFPGLLLTAPAPFGGRLAFDVPLVPSLPGGTDVAVVRVGSTLGPAHLTYYEHVHGRLVPYNPQGILLPNRCPHGGFPFAATFTFQDGSRTSARTAVPCPHAKPSRRWTVER